MWRNASAAYFLRPDPGQCPFQRWCRQVCVSLAWGPRCVCVGLGMGGKGGHRTDLLVLGLYQRQIRPTQARGQKVKVPDVLHVLPWRLCWRVGVGVAVYACE